ncbi:hypothetical protein SODALDRAFT_356416 [Sodiomyces alkalinus F11]|uniref:Uncharacterized protein n=1 Tax=Sodiomyces alkalinus (strain CBS 110278 / VKM F-3762 / F11) TaxID=1314773 RepID=A0A3N2Q128_SODAK|nr:hypothetical protein SODALDRAFT_356416 [Sodiomyces alkalinus F11]ROT40432.1 hypothetical protein SODALDRAFT_356416 [Sodiomyces alkalinus F11]
MTPDILEAGAGAGAGAAAGGECGEVTGTPYAARHDGETEAMTYESGVNLHFFMTGSLHRHKQWSNFVVRLLRVLIISLFGRFELKPPVSLRQQPVALARHYFVHHHPTIRPRTYTKDRNYLAMTLFCVSNDRPQNLVAESRVHFSTFCSSFCLLQTPVCTGLGLVTTILLFRFIYMKYIPFHRLSIQSRRSTTTGTKLADAPA